MFNGSEVMIEADSPEDMKYDIKDIDGKIILLTNITVGDGKTQAIPMPHHIYAVYYQVWGNEAEHSRTYHYTHEEAVKKFDELVEYIRDKEHIVSCEERGCKGNCLHNRTIISRGGLKYYCSHYETYINGKGCGFTVTEITLEKIKMRV